MIERDSKTNQAYWVKKVPLIKAKRELEMLRAVEGNAFPKLIDYEVDEGNFILKLDYIKGETFTTYKARNDYAPYYFRQMVMRLSELHRQGILHRDISPANILIDESDCIYFIDFGSAILKTEIAYESEIVGTLEYAAPEAVFNPKGFDESSDLYALSKVFLEKFKAVSYRFKPEFYNCIMKCQAINPNERYRDYADILHDLESCL